MKKHEVDMNVSSLDDFFDIIEEIVEDPEKFDSIPDNMLFAKDYETIHKVLTDKRLELIRVIKANPELNIDALAKLLKRKREAVSRDLRILESMGVLKLRKEGKKRIPEIQKLYILVALA